jgi:hypothetical protein
MPDPFLLIQESISSIKTEINSLADKYNTSVKEIWIKLTEIETNMKRDAILEDRRRGAWWKSLPIIISLLAFLVSTFNILRELISKMK